jgi:hypothetical protein
MAFAYWSGSIWSTVIACAVLVGVCATGQAGAADNPLRVENAEPQPLVSQALRLMETLEYLGSALTPEDAKRLAAAAEKPLDPETALAIQDIFDAYCLAAVHINPEARVKVSRGPAVAVLMQGGWKNFLVKVHNEAGTRAPLAWESPNAAPVFHVSTGAPNPHPESAITEADLAHRFLELQFYDRPPFAPGLSGAAVEYRVLQVYTTAKGPREGELGFHIGQGTQDLGFRSALPILFECLPSVKVTLRVKDHDGKPAMASFIIRDNIERSQSDQDYRAQKAENSPWSRPGLSAKPLTGVYPLPSRRVADRDEYPDFFFHPQVYRTDGEHVMLPPGRYDVTWTRGPEYLPRTRTITVPDAESHTETFELERWIHLAKMGWYSGDHHVHAGGCSHYESPEAGVKPAAMLRQAQGEDLNVACVLTWGPCWYHQKTFFEGRNHALSTPSHLMRYDVEVSGFPSSHAGHLCLLRLKEDDYPGTTIIDEWPSWTLPVLQWGQQQGGIVGYSHSGWGLEPVDGNMELPNFSMPKMDGIGANEYIVTAVHDAVDFISAGDTPLPWELNIWYHTLNSGLRVGISGETDFPCIFDDRVGMARSYAKIQPLTFDAFADAIRDHTVYVSDGLSHLIDFKAQAGGAEVEAAGELALATPGRVTVTATVAAMLPETQDEAGATIAAGGALGRPYWHLEKARAGTTRLVPVELLVNGYPVATQDIAADGTPRELTFEADIAHSSWIALRIPYSSHTNPIYALVDGQSVRASKRSAQWCRAAVERCWTMKRAAIRQEGGDYAAAEQGYDKARAYYEQAEEEAVDDIGPSAPPVHTVAPLPEGAVVLLPGAPGSMQTPGWQLRTDAQGSYSGPQLRANPGEGKVRYRWLFEDAAPGAYTVSVWVSGGPRAKDAPYRLKHAQGEEAFRVDQSAEDGSWHALGTFTLNADSYLELSDASTENSVAVDAVLLAPAAQP